MERDNAEIAAEIIRRIHVIESCETALLFKKHGCEYQFELNPNDTYNPDKRIVLKSPFNEIMMDSLKQYKEELKVELGKL
jgi:hypothetical protein